MKRQAVIAGRLSRARIRLQALEQSLGRYQTTGVVKIEIANKWWLMHRPSIRRAGYIFDLPHFAIKRNDIGVWSDELQ